MKIALTGGIACGKSLLARFLNDLGIETVDADDIVHQLIPEDERKRLAAVVFRDPAARKALESRIHPLVKAEIARRYEMLQPGHLLVAIIPLLFETHWDAEYDIICSVVSEKATQVARMMTTRGYSRNEAESRLAAQMPVAEKARRSHYVISNEGSEQDLKKEAERLATWLKNLTCLPKR